METNQNEKSSNGEKIVEIIMKNPLTSISFLLLWIIYFLSYIYLCGNNTPKYTQIIYPLCISFGLACVITLISCINLLFYPHIKNYIRNDKGLSNTVNWLDKNLPIEKLATSKFSVGLSALFTGNFLNALIAFAICYYNGLHFRLFVEISLSFIVFNLVMNTIFMFKRKPNERN